jgi:hypothetical protein
MARSKTGPNRERDKYTFSEDVAQDLILRSYPCHDPVYKDPRGFTQVKRQSRPRIMALALR